MPGSDPAPVVRERSSTFRRTPVTRTSSAKATVTGERHGVAACGETVRTRGCGQSREDGRRQARPATGTCRSPTSAPRTPARYSGDCLARPARKAMKAVLPGPRSVLPVGFVAGQHRARAAARGPTQPNRPASSTVPSVTCGHRRIVMGARLTITRWPFRLCGFPHGCGPRPRSRTGALVRPADLRSPLQLLGELVPDLRVVARELNDQFDAVRGH